MPAAAPEPLLSVAPAYSTDPRLLDLLREHLAGRHGKSPPGTAFNQFLHLELRGG